MRPCPQRPQAAPAGLDVQAQSKQTHDDNFHDEMLEGNAGGEGEPQQQRDQRHTCYEVGFGFQSFHAFSFLVNRPSGFTSMTNTIIAAGTML